jgi:ribosomal protein L31E
MQSFINRWLRKILRIRWPETVINEELWERTGQKPLDRLRTENGPGLATHSANHQE